MNAMSPSVLAAGLVVMALAVLKGFGAETKTLIVEAGKCARSNVTMSVDLPAGVTKARMADGGKEVPCQVVEGKLCWILDELSAGATKTYTVEPGAEGGGNPKAVELKKADDGIEILIEGKPFTAYRFTNPNTGAVQTHRPYFWPVLGPGQTPMTRSWPCTDANLPAGVQKDHPHHTSVWVAYGEVGGVDNWSNVAWQVHKDFQAVVSGPVVGLFRQALDWTDKDKKPNLAEVRTARVWRLPESGRVLDLEVVFQAKYGKVLFADTKEGGTIATRMRSELVSDKGAPGRLVNAQGLVGAAAWGKPSEWCDCSGPVEGKTLGYAVFDTPGNLRHPTRWHARTYGLLAANPFTAAAFEKGKPKGDYTLEDGKELTLRYRVYFHAGDEKDGQVAARYADYAAPPKATWK